MRLRAWASGVLVFLFVVAGCSSSGGDEDAMSSSGDDAASGVDLGPSPDVSTSACQQEGFVATSESATKPDTGLLYVASSSEEYPTDRLVVQIFDGDEYGGPTTTGSYRLDGVNYAECGLCVLLYSGCTGATANTCEKVFYAQNGAVEITGLGEVGGSFAGRFKDVVFDEVEIDPNSFESTPIDGGDDWCADGFTFEQEIQGAASSCGAAGQTCIGDEVADFELQSCKTGNMVSMFSLLGRMNALWLVLTSGWCGACEQWVPQVLAYSDEHATNGLKTVIIYGENAQGGQPTLEDCRAHAAEYAEDAGRFYLDHDGASSFAATFAHVYVYPDASGAFGLPWNGVMDARSSEYVYADGAGVGNLDSVLAELLNL